MKSIIRCLTASLIILAGPTLPAQAAGDADDFYEMKTGGEKFLAVLESLPYASEGTGPVMFTFEYSECPYCQGMYRDYKVEDTGLEFRRVFVPVSERSAAEAAAMGKSRNIEDFHAFMTGRKRAPAVFNRDPEAVAAFNAILTGTDEIEAILKQNGWPRRGLVFPQFAWVENGRVFTSAGYEKSDFGKAVARARKGGGTAQVWAQLSGGSDAPAESASASDRSSDTATAGKAPPASGPSRPLDALTAYFIFHKLTGQQPDFNQLASQTHAVSGADLFNKARAQAEEAAKLQAQFEAADTKATYTIGVQAKLNYLLDQEQFEVEAFREGSVLPLQPFRDGPHVMPMNGYRHHGVRLAFANADAARYVPLARDRASVIGSVAQHGVAVAVAEVTFRFMDAENKLPRTVRAEIESVRYADGGRMNRMSSPDLWPLKDAIAVKAVDREALASEARPIDGLTALFVYNKLADEPLEFDQLARHTSYPAKVQRAPAFEKEQAMAEMAARLREQFEATDPAATYTLTLRTQMRYDVDRERYEVDTFGPDRYLPMVAFGAGMSPGDVRQKAQYNRRLTFVNADAARYLPLAAAEARALSPAGSARVKAEVHFVPVDAEDSIVDAEKTLRAQITSVQYTPDSGRVPPNWPFREPVAFDAAEMPSAGSEIAKIDDLKVFYIYHKLSGEPIDYDAIGPMLDKVARAGQFDKETVMAEEIAKLKSGYAAADPDATYTLRVRTNLKYDLDQERFAIEMFEPGRHMLYQPMNALFSSRNATHARPYDRKLFFANGESARYIPIPKAEAARIGHVAQHGSTSASADIELRLVGTGDPTGAVEGRHIVQAELVSLRFPDLDRDIPVEPYDPAAIPVKSAKGFDIVGLKAGIPLAKLQRTIEKEFGPIGAIRPGNNEDPRLVSGIGHNPDGCYALGNNVPEVGSVCIRAFADEGGTVRKIIVEQILEGAEWDPIRVALLQKYGAMAESISKSNNRYFAWGPEVNGSATMDEQLAPQRALTASVSAIQSAMDRMAASTRVSTNLRIRLVDADWAGEPVADAPKEAPRPSGPRL